MIKKSIIYFLVLAFLNFLIVPECSFAYDGSTMGIDKGAVVAVAVGLVVVVVGVALLVRSASKQSVQSQDHQQKPAETVLSKINDGQFTSPSGQIALLRW